MKPGVRRAWSQDGKELLISLILLLCIGHFSVLPSLATRDSERNRRDGEKEERKERRHTETKKDQEREQTFTFPSCVDKVAEAPHISLIERDMPRYNTRGCTTTTITNGCSTPETLAHISVVSIQLDLL